MQARRSRRSKQLSSDLGYSSCSQDLWENRLRTIVCLFRGEWYTMWTSVGFSCDSINCYNVAWGNWFLGNIDIRNINAVIFLDLKKAFDTVGHEIILSKLDVYGISENSFKWFQSYLENRLQQCSVGGSLSDSRAFDLWCPARDHPRSTVTLLINLFVTLWTGDAHRWYTSDICR